MHEVWPARVDVHEAVGAGVVVAAAVAVIGQLVPARLRHRDVVVLEPLAVARAVDVRPVVARRRLALVYEDGVQAVRALQQQQHRRHLLVHVRVCVAFLRIPLPFPYMQR